MRLFAGLLAAILAAQPALAADVAVPEIPQTVAAPIAVTPSLPLPILQHGASDAAVQPLPSIPTAAIPAGQAGPGASPSKAAVAVSAAAQAAELGSAKDSARAAAAAYDGGKPGPSSSEPGPEPPSVPADPAPPRLDPPSPRPTSRVTRAVRYFKDLNAATAHSSKAERRFEHVMELGLGLGLVAPIVLRAEPSHMILYTAPLALAFMVAAFGTVTLWRAARFIVAGKRADAPRESPSRRIAAAALALALGAGLAGAPRAVEAPIFTRVQNAIEPGVQIQAVPGRTLPDAVARELAANPIGRSVLDGLRDRFGLLHMPKMFIGNTQDAIARYNDITDTVTIDRGAIKGYGATDREFLARPDLQAKFARENGALLAHELRHAGQSRRAPWQDGVMRHTMNFEFEYEAFLTEHFWAYEKLKADPHADLTSEENGMFLAGLDDFDFFLKSLDGGYEKDVHIDTPYYRAYFAGLRAQWPAHQVDGYLLMAKRNDARPRVAQMYLKKAAAIAAAHGLPAPQIR